MMDTKSIAGSKEYQWNPETVMKSFPTEIDLQKSTIITGQKIEELKEASIKRRGSLPWNPFLDEKPNTTRAKRSKL